MGSTIAVNPPCRIPAPWPQGRVCASPDCDTILSGYNGTNRCWVHLGWDEIDLDVDFFRVMADATMRDRKLLADELAELMGAA